MKRVLDLEEGHPSLTPEVFDAVMAAVMGPDDEPCCSAPTAGGYGCTREPGHPPPHIATAYEDDPEGETIEVVYAVW